MGLKPLPPIGRDNEREGEKLEKDLGDESQRLFIRPGAAVSEIRIHTHSYDLPFRGMRITIVIDFDNGILYRNLLDTREGEDRDIRRNLTPFLARLCHPIFASIVSTLLQHVFDWGQFCL